MSLVNSALTIGRSALLAYQSALQVVGNNVSNAGTDGYTRQSAVLTPQTGVNLAPGMIPGAGVALTSLRRNIDESIEHRIRVALGDQAGVLAEREALGRIEAVMNELSDADFSTLLQEFFNAFNSLQNQPHDSTSRNQVLIAGDAMARELHRQRADMLSLREELNQSIIDATTRANELLGEVASLNQKITALEGPGGGANALRDQRDLALRELSELVQVQIRQQPNGGVNVYIGNDLAVQDGFSRGLTTALDVVNGLPKAEVRYADTNSEVDLRGGRIEGLIAGRDTHAQGHIDAIDAFAGALIREVNKRHADGQGLTGLSSITSANVLSATDAALNSTDAGLPFAPENGSFQITVWDDADPPEGITTTIQVDLDGANNDDTTLESLVADINGRVEGVTASITADNRLQIVADSGQTFTFGDDSSGVLGAMGVNSFFTGSSTQDIAINAALVNDPRLVAAATGFAPGDGLNAQRLGALESDKLASLQDRSLTEVFNNIVSNVAVRGAAANSTVQATESISLALNAQRESVSGVSLDEETVSLLRLERSFQGAARYTATVDRLLQEMLALV